MILKDYTVLDLETTGLSKNRHRITEIAAVKYNGRRKVGEFHSLINPECKIPRFITKLTGIDDELVKDAPIISKILPEFIDFLGSSTIIAHNASFDYGFINYNVLLHLHYNFLNETLCTRKLANRLLPDLPSKRLSCVCEHFDLVNERAHRAMSDVKVTSKIFKIFLSMMKKQDIKTKKEIFTFERNPRRR